MFDRYYFYHHFDYVHKIADLSINDMIKKKSFFESFLGTAPFFIKMLIADILKIIFTKKSTTY
ncbi:hypothetical protein yinte0001_21690 [Yersinia intermedia ATCC 29909]|nr:hypothetical protein yinte0001_21690 [Yersinia intermedia ATCC 29909]